MGIATLFLGILIPGGGLSFFPVTLGVIGYSVWLHRSGKTQEASRFALIGIGMMKLFPTALFFMSITMISMETAWISITAAIVVWIAYEVSARACLKGKLSWLYGVYVGLILYPLALYLVIFW